MELQRDAVYVLDARDRRHSRGARRAVARYEGAGRADYCLGDVHRDPDDDSDPGADYEVARQKARAFTGSKAPGAAELKLREDIHGRQSAFQQSKHLGEATG